MGWGLGAGPDRRRAAGLAQAQSAAAAGGAAPGARAARHARTRTRMGRRHVCGAVPLRAEIIVSHAHMDGERELRPSPLIAGAAPLDWTPARPAAAEPLPQESLDDRQGPPLAPGGRGGGGLDVLDTQARNPCGPSCATASAAARWRPMPTWPPSACADSSCIARWNWPGACCLTRTRCTPPWPRRGWSPAGAGRGAGRRRDPDRLRPRAQDAGMRARAARARQLAGPGGAAPAVLRRAGREGPAMAARRADARCGWTASTRWTTAARSSSTIRPARPPPSPNPTGRAAGP